MNSFIQFVVGLLLPPGPAWLQKTEPETSYRLEVVLERMEGTVWKTIDSRLILNQDDRIRFRFKSNFSGYLYVTNLSTSGRRDLLFPNADIGRDNRIEANKEYTIPPANGNFRITGPAGQEIVSWLMSPVDLNLPAPPRQSSPASPGNPEKPNRLIPRCDDTILRARGDCVDTSAGLKQSGGATSSLLTDLGGVRNMVPRELVFMQNQNTSVIASPAAPAGPMVYEFALSHR